MPSLHTHHEIFPFPYLLQLLKCLFVPGALQCPLRIKNKSRRRIDQSKGYGTSQRHSCSFHPSDSQFPTGPTLHRRRVSLKYVLENCGKSLFASCQNIRKQRLVHTAFTIGKKKKISDIITPSEDITN